MANCVYLTKYNGTPLECPEENPTETRCCICLQVLAFDRRANTPRHKPVLSKLPR